MTSPAATRARHDWQMGQVVGLCFMGRKKGGSPENQQPKEPPCSMVPGYWVTDGPFWVQPLTSQA